MPQTDQDSLLAIQPELTPGESILWTGQPNAHVIFRKEDLFLIPFSLLWGGFAIFWEAQVSGYGGGNRWAFGTVWGIPFVLIGQYVIWGRFLVTAWKKKRTYYAVTNRRALVVQNRWRRQMASAYLDTLPTLIKESGSEKNGTLRFSQPQPVWSNASGWGVWDGMGIGNVPTFVDIEDVESVYRLVSDARDKARANKITAL